MVFSNSSAKINLINKVSLKYAKSQYIMHLHISNLIRTICGLKCSISTYTRAVKVVLTDTVYITTYDFTIPLNTTHKYHD